MTSPPTNRGVPQYTLEDYETDFADRHLVHDAVRKWARQQPERVAIVEFNTGRHITYKEFDDATTALALQLVQRGFQPGDFLATSAPLLAEHVLLEYACFKIGVIHAPLDLRIKPPEVVRLLKLIRPKGYAFGDLTANADYAALARAVQEQGPPIEHFIQFAPERAVVDGAVAAEVLFTAAAKTAEQGVDRDPAWRSYQEVAAAIQPADGCQVIFTTGSTGLPKPALLSHRNITCQNMCLAGGLGMNEQTRMLVNLPPSHVGCQGEELMTTLFGGGTAVLLHLFDAEQSLRAIHACQVNCFGQIPAMFNMQWQLPNFDDHDLSSVDRVLFGGQQVTRQFVEQLLGMVPRAGTGLGLTEMAGFVTYTGVTSRVDDLVDHVGWPMPVTPLSIRQPLGADGTAGAALSAGEVGEICFSGPQVFVQYVNSAEAYRQTVSREGICYTGDLGTLTERGLVFKGRSKMVIKPKGYQVHPAEIESHFADLEEQVAVCGAVGAEHQIYSEAVVLFVEPKPGSHLTREDLDRHARGIASYMRPLHYVLLPQGGFPLNRVNKTDYVRLRGIARAEVEKLREAGGWDRQPPGA